MEHKEEYNHKDIENKWQKEWEDKRLFEVSEESAKPKWYSLMEFPYPSGEGLHTGHVKGYTAMDIVSRKRRMQGYNVLFPIGWDAFGLPTENYAIKTGKDPKIVTKERTDNYRKQFKSLGLSFDWSREINTTDPKYYRWTQWIFLQLFKSGLAYKTKTEINWCPKDKIGLANEEVVGGCCERCGTVVEKKEKEQWMLAITKYAERLDKDLDTVDYLPQIKTQQRNWIGKSEGSEIEFNIVVRDTSKEIREKIKVFTTRADTLFGVTYVVLAPENKLVLDLKSNIENWSEVEKYILNVKTKTEIDRTDTKKEKTGVELKGVMAVNPANGEEIPVWIADYVLANYGTGCVMAVPAHDERDFEFAKKYNLEIKEVVIPNILDKRNPPIEGKTIVPRKNVHPIVRNKETGKFLALKWKHFDWTTFPMGGVEDDEDIVEAAKREVREETGYTNLKLVKVLDGQVRAEYFAAHKDQNRVSYTTAVVFDLTDETQIEVDQKEKDAHDIIWLDESELNYNVMTHAEVEIWKEKMKDNYINYTGDGFLINSGEFSNTESIEAKKKITEFVGGKMVTTFKLRDWVFSRQRYWGEPIPLIRCENCANESNKGWIAVPETDLPVMLPQVDRYEPRDDGESPLSSIEEWVNVKCPNCGSDAKRETDVMPNWAGSSWYYLRYMDPANDTNFADKENLDYWNQVDWYNGGMEHTTLHLLYSRFWHKFLFDKGFVSTNEPYKKRTSHGLILAEGGEKMSKSKGNVINPDTIVDLYGADSLRLYEMFMGPFDQAIPWSTENIIGVRRFIERVWRLQNKLEQKSETTKFDLVLNKTIQKVSDDIENMRFNTAISSMMILLNEFEKQETVPRRDFEIFLKLLSPFAPHIAEEMWSNLGNTASLAFESWPDFDESKLLDETVDIMVQINGKVRGKVKVPTNSSESFVLEEVNNTTELNKWLVDLSISKVFYVKNRLINIVV